MPFDCFRCRRHVLRHVRLLVVIHVAPSSAESDVFQPLLEMPGPASQKAMVAVTSLVNNYCRVDGQCAERAELQAVIRILAEMLKYNCKPADQQDHDHMMLVLKAMANAGRAEKYVATLNRCMRNEDAGLDVRVAAINAMGRLSCEVDVRVHKCFNSPFNVLLLTSIVVNCKFKLTFTFVETLSHGLG